MRHKNRERLMACLQLAASAQQANLTAQAARVRARNGGRRRRR